MHARIFLNINHPLIAINRFFYTDMVGIGKGGEEMGLVLKLN